MSSHELKIDPELLEEILSGKKRHEVRVNDRDYKVGDTLKLRAFCRKENRYLNDLRWEAKVTHITNLGTFGLPENIIIMSILNPYELLKLEYEKTNAVLLKMMGKYADL